MFFIELLDYTKLRTLTHSSRVKHPRRSFTELRTAPLCLLHAL